MTIEADNSAAPVTQAQWQAVMAPTLEWLARRAEPVAIGLGAILFGLALFSLFILAVGKSPTDLFRYMYQGGFGSWFSIQNSLSRAAPLLLTALCVALPARLGLVIIGGEGAVVLGGVAAAAIALPLVNSVPPLLVLLAMAIAAMAMGAVWIGFVGFLRHYRGVNETIASLLMAYIAIALMNQFIEGPLRDPASLNKPSTAPLPAIDRLGNIPGMDVHWGLVIGIVA